MSFDLPPISDADRTSLVDALLAIIDAQIAVAIKMLRKAANDLKRGSRSTAPRKLFLKIFRVWPEFVPTWLKTTATIKDRGDVVQVRCAKVADLLASGTIKFFCAINSTNCPDCGNDNSGFGCSSWGDESVDPAHSRVICLGNDFWDAMKNGDTVSILATIMHEPFHIYFGKYVTEHVMDRGKFGHSRMLVEYDDKSHVATCSIHCAAKDMVNSLDKSPAAVKVADYHTRELIDADKAVWVLGGKVSGVMTARAKWAFAGQAEAERFVAANGGEIVTYAKALDAAYDEMEQDSRMIREKRKMKRMQKQGGGVAK